VASELIFISGDRLDTFAVGQHHGRIDKSPGDFSRKVLAAHRLAQLTQLKPAIRTATLLKHIPHLF
jgi:hypothetical protein